MSAARILEEEDEAAFGCEVDGCRQPLSGPSFCGLHELSWNVFGNPRAKLRPRRKIAATYLYCNEHDFIRFAKVRYRLTWPLGYYVHYGDYRLVWPGDEIPSRDIWPWPGSEKRPPKTFSLKHPGPGLYGGLVYGKPTDPEADSLLYRLPEVLDAIEAGETIFWAEGEKDANNLVRASVCATTHWQGAAIGPNAEQAQWLAGARRVVICVDLDDTGFRDALCRYELVAEVIGPRRVSVVCARVGNDVSDHLAAGFTVEQLQRVPIPRLRAGAKRATPAKVRANGYGLSHSHSHEWTNRINRELEQLAGGTSL